MDVCRDILAVGRFYWHPSAVGRGIKNFFHLPFGRATRFFWSGFMYFVVNVFKTSRVGARY